MKIKLYQTLAFALLVSTALSAQNCVLKIGSVADSRGAQGWTLDGFRMTDNIQKFQNPNNFGPAGTVPYTVQITSETAPITQALLSNYDLFFIGFFPDGTFSAAELQAMFDWVNNGGRMLITADAANFDAVAAKFGYPSTTQTTNLNLAEPTQLNHPIFQGPFGTITQFNGAGSLGYFPTTTGATILARSTQNFATLLEKSVGAGHIVLSGDICQFDNATMTAGGVITNNNDILFANLFHYASAKTCCTAPTVTCRDVTIHLGPSPVTITPTGPATSQLPAQTKGVIPFCPAPATAAASCNCPTGSVAVGYSGEVGTFYGGTVSKFRLNCRAVNPDGTFGAATTVTCDNGTAAGTAPASQVAAPGQALVGFQNYVGCAIDQLNGKSKPLAAILASTPNSTNNPVPPIGNVGGTLRSTQLAPDGYVIVGMQTYVDLSTGHSAGYAWNYAKLADVMKAIATVTVDCGLESVTLSKSSFDCSNIGVNNVTVTATGSGGSAQCNFTVTVIDNEIPVVTCPTPNASYTTDAGECNATLSFAATATDNCGVSSYAYSVGGNPISFPYDFTVGTTTVTAVATDAGNNTSQPCSFDVVVKDNEAPVVTCPTPNASYNTDAGECNATLSFAATATDNCGVSSYVYSVGGNPISFPYDFAVGTTKVTVVATDIHGNASQPCSFDVVVKDNEAPVVTCPTPNASYNTDAGECNATLSFAATATDNCGVSSYAYSVGGNPISFPYDFAVGTTSVKVVATDIHGNASQPCSFSVVVKDNQAPVVTCPTLNASYNTDAGECNATLSFAATATDNCGVSSYAYSVGGNPISFPYDFAVGTTTVKVVATDIHGNASQPCSFSVVVKDNQAPTISCPANIVVSPTSVNGAVVNYTVVFGDNCPGATKTLIAGYPSGATFPIGTTTVTYKVRDAYTNSATCSFTVTVRDPYCDKDGKNTKVNVCHSGNTLCISINALQTHLAHGDQLGKCEWYTTVRMGKPSLIESVEPSFNLYPNPTTGLVNVRLDNVKKAEIVVLNGDGAVMEKRSISDNKKQILELNLSRYAAGVYTIRVVSDDNIIVKKVIVQR
jgi:nitrite reductase/ring-hydroxylating ferredoxin subunit